MASDFDTQQKESQELLIQFLQTELDLGTTFVLSAVIAGKSDLMEHFDHAKGSAEKAAETIGLFVGRVQDSRTRAEFVEQLFELDRRISALVTAPTKI